MKNDDVVTRNKALEALWNIDGQANGYISALSEALKDENARIRFLAATRLREKGIVEAAKPAIPALLEALHDKDSDMRLNVIQTLNSIGADKQGVAAVSKLLQDNSVPIQLQAHGYLKSLGSDAREAVPALLAALKNDKGGVLPFYTLEAIGPAAKDAIPELTKLLRSDNKGLREKAMQSLKKISPDDKH